MEESLQFLAWRPAAWTTRDYGQLASCPRISNEHALLNKLDDDATHSRNAESHPRQPLDERRPVGQS